MAGNAVNANLERTKMPEEETAHGVPGFTLTDSGFHLTLENGYTLSVQWGPHNYISRRNFSDSAWKGYTESEVNRWAKEGSPDAEIAIFGPDGNLIQLEGECDQVKGWVKPDEILTFLIIAAKMNKVSRIHTDAKLLEERT